MTRRLGTAIVATVFAAGLAVFATWPTALHMSTAIFSHHDAYFSVWRLAWIAHGLTTSPLHLFDANIFYPTNGTLAYSDAMLLEGFVGTPLFMARVPPVLIYNLLLLAGFAGSAVAMFVLVKHLTGSTGPSLVAATVFTLAPFRIEHAMHLELQWAMWMPLTFWALHRTVEDRSWRFGAIAGLLVWLQIISCVYYGVFLGVALLVFVPILLLLSGTRGIRALPGLALGAVIALLLTLPYAWPYLQAGRALGGRDIAEIARYSAQPVNYLSATGLNWLWGWTADRWGSRELRLFPGVVAIALAIWSVSGRSWRHTILYALTTAVAVELSFGSNTTIYRWLLTHVTALEGFRSAARFAIVASSGLAVLAGLGTHALIERGVPRARWRIALVPAILVLLGAEYANRPMPLTTESLGTPAPIYQVIRSAGPGVVLELPVPSPSELPGWDAYYSAWSITHWNSLVNGYSGYHPRDYLRTLALMKTFPDDASVSNLNAHDVRYIVVHRGFIDPDRYTQLMLRMAARREFHSWGSYKDPVGLADLFVLER